MLLSSRCCPSPAPRIESNQNLVATSFPSAPALSHNLQSHLELRSSRCTTTGQGSERCRAHLSSISPFARIPKKLRKDTQNAIKFPPKGRDFRAQHRRSESESPPTETSPEGHITSEIHVLLDPVARKYPLVHVLCLRRLQHNDPLVLLRVWSLRLRVHGLGFRL